MNDENVLKLLARLQRLTAEHGVRAPTLVPDLALVGMAQDAVDASEAARCLLMSDRPYRAYAMARVVFEASQVLLTLCTAADYELAGSQAWLFYRLKDAALGEEGDASIGDSEQKMIDLWTQYSPEASAKIEEALTILNEKRGAPDNYLKRNMGKAVTGAYQVLLSASNIIVPENATEVNRRAYASLCRDTHACLRLEPASLTVDADGFIAITQRTRSPAAVAAAVHLSLATCLSEASTAIAHRLAGRRRANAEAQANLVQAGETRPLPGSYVPDLGKDLLAQGMGHASIVFYQLPVRLIQERPDGTLSLSVGTGQGDDARLATFDFRGNSRTDLLTIIEGEHPDFLRAAPRPLHIDLPIPLALTIKASLGTLQTTSDESFIPFVVDGVERV